MNWTSIAQYSELALALLLVVRLLSLNLHRVYRYFCFFLLTDISGSVIWAFQRASRHSNLHFDYRIAWLGIELLQWPLTLLMVYALLGAILANLQGILRLSRKFLNMTFVIAMAIGTLSAVPEYRAATATGVLNGPLAEVTQGALVVDRVITSVSLLALLCMLLFLLWFPVRISRNLSIFFVGFAFYFALRGAILLVPSYISPQLRHLMNIAQALVSACVFAFWGIAITTAGEHVSKKLSPLWSQRQEDLLIHQLEAINDSLLHTVHN